MDADGKIRFTLRATPANERAKEIDNTDASPLFMQLLSTSMNAQFPLSVDETAGRITRISVHTRFRR